MFFKKWFCKNKEIEFDLMKYLIVGLGNMGAEYENTRHNIGFSVLEHLARQKEASFKDDLHGDLANFRHKGRTYYLLKPSTFMNLSGKAVRYWTQKLSIAPENLLIITDDLNINFGDVRIRKKGSAGGHNGLSHIEQLLGHSNYNRMRLGIGGNFSKGHQVNFVLGKWNESEKAGLDAILSHAANAILDFGTMGMDETMNRYNKKI